MNLNGVVFFDVGNAWDVDDSPFVEEVKAGYGVGIRWMSPMGPIRIEYGWKVNPRKGEEPGAFAFGMGAAVLTYLRIEDTRMRVSRGQNLEGEHRSPLPGVVPQGRPLDDSCYVSRNHIT